MSGALGISIESAAEPFLRQIDRETPSDREIHLIADNYSTHKHPTVLRWIARRPRFHLHFTPTSASWLNMFLSGPVRDADLPRCLSQR